MTERPLRLGETIAWGLAGLSLFLGCWTLLSISGLVPRQFLPTPLEVVTRFIQLLTTPFAGATLPQHLASSFQRYLCGVMLAALVGVPLGLLMGWFRLLDDILSPIFEGLRFIAPIAWIPFAALWFGTGHLRTILEVLLPASVPTIVAGLRVAAGLGWQSLVGAELIVAAAGVGFMMVQAQANVSTPTVMTGMIAIGIAGMLIDVLLRYGEALILRRRGLAA